MSGLAYLLVEGVHGVAFTGRLLAVCFDATRIETMEELDDAPRTWMGSFKWPIPQGGKTAAERQLDLAIDDSYTPPFSGG